MSTPQAQAVSTANGFIGAARTLLSLYSQISALDAQWTDDNVATILAAMQTVALNPDGSTGAADATPNAAHPIQPTLGISQALSSNQIGQLKTILDGIVNYVGGQAVTTQVGARAILNAAVGG